MTTDPQAALRARAEQWLALKQNTADEFGICRDESVNEAYRLVRDLLAALVGERPPAQDEQKERLRHALRVAHSDFHHIARLNPSAANVATTFANAVEQALFEVEQADPASPLPRPEARLRRTEKQLRDTVSMLAHLIWHKQTRPGDHVWSIPVDKERDWDCILTDAIDELIERRAEVRALEARLRAVEAAFVKHMSQCPQCHDAILRPSATQS